MFSVNVECITKGPNERDIGVEGLYRVHFGFAPSKVSAAKHADIALDLFHRAVAIAVLDDFEITVLDAFLNPVLPASEHEYDPQYGGTVEKIDNRTFLIPEGRHLEDSMPSIETVLADPSASSWLKTALSEALKRDVVDAANDADMLAKLLSALASAVLAVGQASRRVPGQRDGA